MVPEEQLGNSADFAPGTAIGRAGSAALSLANRPIPRVIARRLVVSVPLLFVVSALVFVLESLIPGNAAYVILGSPASSGLPPSAYKQVAHQLGLNLPLPVQYWHWLSAALHGDLGVSLITKQPVALVISQRLPVTLFLVAGALIVSVVVGVSLGILSAVNGGWFGRTVDAFSMAGWVLPVYWLAAEMIVVFAVDLGWFPASGYVSLATSPSTWFRSLVLPVIALAVGPAGAFAKFTREAMLDALASEYVKVARANGISEASIVFRHALKPASLQVVTIAGLVTVGLLTGTVFVENVFALPGLGSAIVSATTQSDIPMVQGVTVLFTLIVIAVNLCVDVAYCLLNPKVRVG